MRNITQNEWILLRAMMELGATIRHKAHKSQLQPLTDLSDDDYDQAANYLHSMGYIEGRAEEDRSHWLSPEGVEFFQEQMRNRMKLSWTAERIIRHMIEQIPYHGIPILWTEIQQALELDDTQYTKACQELADYQLIKNVGAVGHYFGSITVTQLGRLAQERTSNGPILPLLKYKQEPSSMGRLRIATSKQLLKLWAHGLSKPSARMILRACAKQ